MIRGVQRHMRTLLSRLNSFLAENLSGMRIIQVFIREKRQYEQFQEMNEQYYKAGMKNSTLNSVFQPTIMFIGNIAMAVMVWYGGNKVLSGAITFGVVFAFITYIQQFYRPLMSLADRYGQIQTAMASAERILSCWRKNHRFKIIRKRFDFQKKFQGVSSFKTYGLLTIRMNGC